jgi:hypothetical protein
VQARIKKMGVKADQKRGGKETSNSRPVHIVTGRKENVGFGHLMKDLNKFYSFM